MYTSDIGVGTEQLYAATVASSRAHAHISKIDLSDAEKVLNSHFTHVPASMLACGFVTTGKLPVCGSMHGDTAACCLGQISGEIRVESAASDITTMTISFRHRSSLATASQGTLGSFMGITVIQMH